jgi:hypothetical protein
MEVLQPLLILIWLRKIVFWNFLFAVCTVKMHFWKVYVKRTRRTI